MLFTIDDLTGQILAKYKKGLTLMITKCLKQHIGYEPTESDGARCAIAESAKVESSTSKIVAFYEELTIYFDDEIIGTIEGEIVKNKISLKMKII